jgi:hypothetical protein
MAEDKGFAVTTTIEIPLLRRDGRLHFQRAKPRGVRVLEWTLAGLWLSVAGVAIAAVI